MTIGSGVRLAVTTLTVLPVRGGRIDRRSAATAMSLAPLVGALLGGLAAAAAYGMLRAGASALLGGLVAVAVLALATRALHLDGLADTVDALGSYADRDRALAIMKSPEVGPFGVVALVLVLGVDASAIGQLAAAERWWAIPVGLATGRLAITLACCRGVPAARPDGLGALVAGSVSPAVAAAWLVPLAVAGWLAEPDNRWLGPLAVLLGTGLSVLLVLHLVRRLGGITGDVLGAACELATAAALVVLVLR